MQRKVEFIEDTEIQIDTVNPGKYAWKSFWEPDMSGYQGSYFKDQEKKSEFDITSPFETTSLVR